MIEGKERVLSPGEIGLNVTDTGFLLSVLNRASIQGSELKKAMSITTKIENLHEFLLNHQEVVKGKY